MFSLNPTRELIFQKTILYGGFEDDFMGGGKILISNTL